jgi:hypothetical protein
MGTTRTWVPLMGAVAIHAAGAAIGFWLESALETEVSDGVVAPQADSDVTEIALIETPAAHTLIRTPAALEIVAAPSIATRIERRSPQIADSDSEQRPTPDPALSESPRSTEEYVLDPSAARAPERSIDLGITAGSWSKWGTLTGGPPTTGHVADRVPAPVSSTGGLAEALATSDHEKGLGPSGAVLSAVREAASWEGAPRSGVTQFTVTLDQRGEVDVALASADSNGSAWTEVGERIARMLRLRRPRVKTGVRMVVELVAKDRWANGSSTEPEGPRLSVTLPVPRSTDESKADLERRNLAAAPAPGAPADQRRMALIPDAPGVFVSGRGRLGTVAIGAGAFSEVGHGDPPKRVTFGPVLKGDVDVTNLAAKSARTISTKILSVRAF